jgi:DNA repair exonuclease SbcCD ATPase subunit
MKQMQDHIDKAQGRLDHVKTHEQDYHYTEIVWTKHKKEFCGVRLDPEYKSHPEDRYDKARHDKDINEAEKALQTEVNKAVAMIARLQSQLTSMTQSNSAVQNEVTDLQNNLNHFKQQHNVTDDDLSTLLQTKTDQLSELKREIHELEQVPSQIAEAEEIVATRTRVLEQHNQNLADLEQRRDQEYTMLMGRLQTMDEKELAYILAEIYQDETKGFICQAIMELGFDANYLGHYALEKNDLSLFEIALSHGLDLDSCYNSKTILQRLAEFSQTEFMDFVCSNYDITADIDLDHIHSLEMLGEDRDYTAELPTTI